MMLLPLHRVTLAGGALAAGVFALPDEWRVPTWCVLGVGYLGVAAWGSLSMASGLLGPATVRGPTDAPNVALTFDDGPDPRVTPALLDLLARRGVRATFFCVGERVAAHPDVARRIVAEGHVLANHGARHAWWTNLLLAAPMRREIARAQDDLRTHTGVTATFYRPPFGLMNHAVWPACRALGLHPVGWTVRGLDTTARSVDAVVRRVSAGLAPGAIVLLHDGGQAVVRVLDIAERVLDDVAARGLRAVGLDVLLGVRSGSRVAAHGSDAAPHARTGVRHPPSP